MNIADTTLPLWLNHVFNMTFCLVILFSLKTYGWRDLFQNNALQHRVGFAIVVLVVMWSMRAGVTDGLGIHFYLITCFHLMFGWRLSVLLVALVQLGMIIIGNEAWTAFGINGLTAGIIPIIATYIAWRFVEHRQWYNPFAYIFGVAFAGSAFAVVCSGIFMTLVFLLLGIYSLELIVYEYWAFVPLVALPEAILNGMAIAALIVFKPEWVAMYDEEKYLSNFQ